jgi:hypothetical protein
MFSTECAIISPGWTFSCQKIADPIGSVAIFAAHPPDYVRFRANGSHHRLEPTGLYRRANRYGVVRGGGFYRGRFRYSHPAAQAFH